MLNGELLGVMGREGTHANTNTQLPTNTHHFSTAPGNNGGGSHRHPPSGMCGRESCQALWGGKGTRANTTTTPSPPSIHHTQPSKQPWGQLNSTPTKWGVWKGELSGVVGREGHPRQHDHYTFTTFNPPHTTFKTTMGAAQFDTHQVGCVEGRAVRRCGEGRAPAPTRPLHLHHLQSTIHNLQNNYGGGSIRHPLSGVCGRESCQALRRGGHRRQHDHYTFTNTNPPYTTFKTTMGAAQFDTHQVGCVEGRAVRRCGGGCTVW